MKNITVTEKELNYLRQRVKEKFELEGNQRLVADSNLNSYEALKEEINKDNSEKIGNSVLREIFYISPHKFRDTTLANLYKYLGEERNPSSFFEVESETFTKSPSNHLLGVYFCYHVGSISKQLSRGVAEFFFDINLKIKYKAAFDEKISFSDAFYEQDHLFFNVRDEDLVVSFHAHVLRNRMVSGFMASYASISKRNLNPIIGFEKFVKIEGANFNELTTHALQEIHMTESEKSIWEELKLITPFNNMKPLL